MAAFDTTRPHFAAAPAAGRSNSFLLSLMAAFSAWNDARVTRKSLGKLTDRELDDIGLTRADIDRVAEGR